MDKKFLAFLRSLPTIAQNMHLNISLEGWPGAIAVWALSGAVIGVAAIFASAKSGGDKTSDKEEALDEREQNGDSQPTEGSSEEADDPASYCD